MEAAVLPRPNPCCLIQQRRWRLRPHRVLEPHIAVQGRKRSTFLEDGRKKMGVMKMKAISSRGFVHSLLAGMGLLILSAGLASGSDGRDSERQIAVTINPGETYVIQDLSAGATP